MIRKAVRTAQNWLPALRETKNKFYHWSRSTFGLLHDRDFRLIARLPVRPDDLFLDIGGNRGQSILSLRRMRPGVAVVSFEPSGTMFAWLARRFGALDGVRLVHAGLGRSTDRRTLFTPRYGDFAYDGLATFSRETARSYLSADTVFGFDPERLSVDEEMCEIRTLDSFGLKPTFIKIDVEGLEHEVLEGGEATIRAWQPVLMVERFHDNPHLMPLLERLGYVEVRPVGRTLEQGSTTSENMLCMTPAGLRALTAQGPASPRHRQTASPR